MKTGVVHINHFLWPPPSEAFKPKYRARVEKENAFLRELCSGLVERDPEAVVILMGDHGAFGYAGGWWRRPGDPLVLLAEQGKDVPSVVHDCTDIFLAIRLGAGAEEALPVRSPVNLFRELFRYLSGDGRLGGLREPDDTYGRHEKRQVYRLAADGRPLKRFEPVEPRELLEAERRP